MVLVSSCHTEQIVPYVCTTASSVCDHVIPNSHCHTPDNSFGSDLALKSTRHQMGSHRLLRPKHPVLQCGFLFVCYTLVIAHGVGRSFWMTPGRFTLLDLACSESSSFHPSSAGGCRGGGASGAMVRVMSSPAASATAQWRKICKPDSSNGDGSGTMERETEMESAEREKNSREENCKVKLKRIFVRLHAKILGVLKKSWTCQSNFLKKNGGENIFGIARIPGGFTVWQPSGLSFLFVSSTSIKRDRNRKC